MARVLFFGRLRDIAGTSELDVAMPPTIDSVAEVRALLSGRDAALGAALSEPGVRVAVDWRFASDDTPVRGAQELAFMSPLSGG
jgi:sulfur-carrier protein